VIKDGMGGRRFARPFSWSAATERLVNAIFVVVDPELFQLPLQVDCGLLRAGSPGASNGCLRPACAAIYRYRAEVRIEELTGVPRKATALSLRSAGNLQGYLLRDISRPIFQIQCDDTQRSQVPSVDQFPDNLFAAGRCDVGFDKGLAAVTEVTQDEMDVAIERDDAGDQRYHVRNPPPIPRLLIFSLRLGRIMAGGKGAAAGDAGDRIPPQRIARS
jgi:hypothetical protein